MKRTVVQKALEKFLDEFPDDARSWAQATGEISDMYHWMTQFYNMQGCDDDPLRPVGRENCPTPAVWNTRYKAAIRSAFVRFTPPMVELFQKRFAEWLQ